MNLIHKNSTSGKKEDPFNKDLSSWIGLDRFGHDRIGTIQQHCNALDQAPTF